MIKRGKPLPRNNHPLQNIYPLIIIVEAFNPFKLLPAYFKKNRSFGQLFTSLN